MVEESKDVDTKEPPADEQMYSALSFAIMLILVGIPLWWKTTEVYRVALPYAEIDELQDDSFKIQFDLDLATIDIDRGESIAKDLNRFLEHSKIYRALIKTESVPKALLGECKTLAELERRITHPKLEGSIQLMEVPGLSRFTPRNVLIGQNRTIYFSTEADAVMIYHVLETKILAEDRLNRTVRHVQAPPKGKMDEECSRRVSPAAAYDVLVTVLHPEPEQTHVELDLIAAIKAYLDPFVNELRVLNDFHVKSQWLYLVSLQVQPKLVESDVKHYALSESALAHVITPLEKKLASQVSKHPCLNFVLWVPPCSMSPLHVYSDSGLRIEGKDAFLSPRWGGIQIYNPPSDQCELAENVTVRPDVKKLMPVFLEQLRLLLGIQNLDQDVQQGHISESRVHLRSWQKDALIRSRTVEQLTIAKHTLQSLSELLGKISNIVINDHIGASIIGSLEAIRSCEKALGEGKLVEAYRQSQKAYLESEAAFTDPSLLALLYFPEDQKYAVYIPLFLPVMIPVLISFKPLREWLFRKIKGTAKAKVD